MRSTERRGGRRGFSLIETMLTVVLIGIIVSGVAAHLLTVAQQNQDIVSDEAAAAALLENVNRISAVHFDSIEIAELTCDTVTVGDFEYERCTQVDSISQFEKKVTVVVTPAEDSEADTLVFYRTKTRSNPFYTGT